MLEITRHLVILQSLQSFLSFSIKPCCIYLGTGKTLMARQIGKMLSAREPKIVNGPEILNKYVGESEANIRSVFQLS